AAEKDYYFVVAAVKAWTFFFSSRRRHTRFSRDWSSDVCSSDLDAHHQEKNGHQSVVDPEQYGVFEVYLRCFEADLLRKQGLKAEIGRASCRERGEGSVGVGGCKREQKDRMQEGTASRD